MNLLATSPDSRFLFIGNEHEILQLALSAAGVPRLLEARVPLDASPRACIVCAAPADVHCADCAADYDERHFRDAHERPVAMTRHVSSAHQLFTPAKIAASVEFDDAAVEQKQEFTADSNNDDDACGPVAAAPNARPPSNESVSNLYHILALPTLEPSQLEEQLQQLGPRPTELNCLRVGYVGSRPVLAATTMEGHSCLYDLHRLATQQRFGAGRLDSSLHVTGTAIPSEPDLVQQHLRPRWDDNSAWSLGFSPRGSARPMVVVGSNACRAWLWQLATPPETDPEAMLPSHVLAGHNVPSVDVSSCGRFLAMSCIDATLRVARLCGSDKQGRYLSVKDVDSEWGWCVRWIPAWAVQQRSCTYDQTQAHLQHAPVAPWLQQLQAEPPSVAGGAAAPVGAINPVLEHMVEQLMLQVGANMPPAAQQALRADLHRQVAHMLRVRQQEEHEEDVHEHDDEEDEEEEEAEEADENEEAEEMEEGEDEDGNAIDFGELAEEGEEDEADADAGAPLEDRTVEMVAAAAAMNGNAERKDADADGSPPPLADEKSEGDEKSALPAPSTAAPIAPAADDSTTDLLIYTSKSHVYLLDCKLTVLASLQHVCQPTLTLHRSLHRVLFVESIPSLGVLLLASSGGDRVLLVRMERFACGKFNLRIERALPEQPCGMPIKGLAVCRVPTAGSAAAGSAASFEGTSLAVEMEQMRCANKAAAAGSQSGVQEMPPVLQPPSPTSSAEGREEERWRVYILFANRQLAAFEIKQEPQAQAFDVASFFP
jgi:hypothetical protein